MQDTDYIRLTGERSGLWLRRSKTDHLINDPILKALQLLAGSGVEGSCVQPHNLAFSEYRSKAGIWHLEGPAPSNLNQINLLYIWVLWNQPSLTYHRH